MGFLAKIRNYIKRYRGRDFRTSLSKEKSQKYLFRDLHKDHARSKGIFFKKYTNRLSPFSRFIQSNIGYVGDLARKQSIYMGYIGVFLICASIYIVVYSPYFHISPSKVMIEALTEDINISLAYRTIENLYGKNVFLIDEPEIAQSLKKNQRNIKEIRIDRLYPNGLKILLSGYPILFDITFPEDTKQGWGITENGIIIPKDQIKTPVKKKIIFYGDTLGEGTLLEYKEIISEKRIKIIEKTLLFLEENYPDFKIEKIYYLEKENEFHIVGKNNTHLLLALQDITEKNTQKPLYKNLRASLLSLKAFIEDRKVDFIAGQYIYIDARIPGKIFFCKNTSICLSNLKLVYGDEYK